MARREGNRGYTELRVADDRIDLEVSGSRRIDLDVRESFISGGGSAVKMKTTEQWMSTPSYIPPRGEIDVYTDYETVTDEHGDPVLIPAIKIGDGKTYGVDLPFVGDDIRISLLNHINNNDVHITALDRDFWNNKLNVDDMQEVVENELIFNRN